MLARFYVGLDRAYSICPNELDILIRLGQDHADTLFGGSTVYCALGSWQREREAVAVFEIALEPEGALCAALGVNERKIRIFARWLRRAFGQKAVLVVKLASQSELV